MDNTVIDLLNKRYGGRAIDSKPLPERIVFDLIEAARLTPSCFNNQPWRFIFLEGPEGLAKGTAALAEPNRAWASKAPLLIVGYSKKENDCVLKDGRAYHQFDLGMATMNLLMAATDHGLAARPMAGFSPEKAKELFELGENDEPLIMIAVGYPSKDESHLPDHLKGKAELPRERKDTKEILRCV